MIYQFKPATNYRTLPPVIKNLILINVAMYLLKLVLGKMGINLDAYLGLFYWESPYFRIWQPITHLFMHADFSHLLFNMFALWWFGSNVENVLGSKKFLMLYIICGLGAALCQLGVYHFQLIDLMDAIKSNPNEFGVALTHPNSRVNVILIGASGAVYGILFAYGYLFPKSYPFFFIPLQAKYVVGLYALSELLAGMKNNVNDNVAHFAHLGGMIFAFFVLWYWRKKGRLFLS